MSRRGFVESWCRRVALPLRRVVLAGKRPGPRLRGLHRASRRSCPACTAHASSGRSRVAAPMTGGRAVQPPVTPGVGAPTGSSPASPLRVGPLALAHRTDRRQARGATWGAGRPRGEDVGRPPTCSSKSLCSRAGSQRQPRRRTTAWPAIAAAPPPVELAPGGGAVSIGLVHGCDVDGPPEAGPFDAVGDAVGLAADRLFVRDLAADDVGCDGVPLPAPWFVPHAV